MRYEIHKLADDGAVLHEVVTGTDDINMARHYIEQPEHAPAAFVDTTTGAVCDVNGWRK